METYLIIVVGCFMGLAAGAPPTTTSEPMEEMSPEPKVVSMAPMQDEWETRNEYYGTVPNSYVKSLPIISFHVGRAPAHQNNYRYNNKYNPSPQSNSYSYPLNNKYSSSSPQGSSYAYPQNDNALRRSGYQEQMSSKYYQEQSTMPNNYYQGTYHQDQGPITRSMYPNGYHYQGRYKRSAQPFGFFRRIFRGGNRYRGNNRYRGSSRQSNNNNNGGGGSSFEPSHYTPQSKYFNYYKPASSKTLGKSCCPSGTSGK